jgi:hypothetical protein
MRTTLDIDDDLLRRAKELSARTRRTLTSIVEDALREVLSRRTPASSRRRVKLPVSDQSPGLCPGVDLDHTAALLDVMEQPHVPA